MIQLPQHIQIYRIINYLRKSRQDIENEKKFGQDTLSQMREQMESVLKNYEIPYDTKEEIGSGDKISTRPVFTNVLNELREGKYNAIAVKEISRLGRGSFSDAGIIYDLIIEKRIYIITPWRIYDPTNPQDLKMIRFELFMSREEFEMIKERLMSGKYNNAFQGRWTSGAAPFGYKRNDKTRNLEIVKEEADVVRLIGDYWVYGIDGKDVRERAIATQLKRLGIKTPKGKSEWRPMQITRILNNIVYNGQIWYRITKKIDGKNIERPEHEHIKIENCHEKIFDDTMWTKIQLKLNNRVEVPKTQLDFSPCELAGFIYCSKCGRKMVRQYSIQKYTKVDGEVSTYNKEFLWCTTQGCTFVKYRNVEESLLMTLDYLIKLDSESLKLALKKVIAPDKDNVSTIDKKELLQQIEKSKKELHNRLNFIFEQFEKQIYNEETFLSRKAAIEKELTELNKVKIEEDKEDSEKEIDVDIVRENLKEVLEIYKSLNNKTTKNTLLRGIFRSVYLTITEKGKGQNSSKFELDIKVSKKVTDALKLDIPRV